MTLALPLVTRRLQIRDYREDDASAVFAYVRDPVYWQFQRAEPPTAQQIEALLRWVVTAQAAEPRTMYYLAATHKETGEIIGEGVLKILSPADRQAEIGFGVSPRHWKTGLGSEIAAAMLDAAFKHLKLHRVAAQCSPENKGSIRIMQKLGMAREGLLRDLQFGRGKWWSTVVYSILEHEFEKIRVAKGK
jgi:RimJ/RimL family protein N-acetyltransferase